jgi:hypothetical protein
MLIIRPPQVEAIQREMDRTFARAVADDLCRHGVGSAARLGQRERLQVVDEAIERARGYGLRSSYSLAMFAYCVFLLGVDFDEVPPLRFALQDAEVPANERIDRLLDSLLPWQWDVVRRRCLPASASIL